MIKAVLIDLSGTLHIENEIITGAREALAKLRKTNVFIRFVTNTTKESGRILYERLISLGFNLKQDEIYSSLSAARKIIQHRKLKPMLLISEEAKEDFEGLECPTDQTPNSVVIGLAPNCFNYETLTEAFRYLKSGASLIAIHAAKYYKRSDGLALGPGCFVKGLEYSAECKAELVGKPNQLFFRSALPEDIPPEQTIMIGDDVTDDVKGALEAGLKGILVKTGKYQIGDEKKILPLVPTKVCDSFVEAVDYILDNVQ